jgi:hypothetical protein
LSRKRNIVQIPTRTLLPPEFALVQKGSECGGFLRMTDKESFSELKVALSLVRVCRRLRVNVKTVCSSADGITGRKGPCESCDTKPTCDSGYFIAFVTTLDGMPGCFRAYRSAVRAVANLIQQIVYLGLDPETTGVVISSEEAKSGEKEYHRLTVTDTFPLSEKEAKAASDLFDLVSVAPDLEEA